MATQRELLRSYKAIGARKRVRTHKRERAGKIEPTLGATLGEEDFALSPTPKETQQEIRGSLPIDTIGKAKRAIDEGCQFATGAELSQIVRKVKARYPGMKISPGFLRLFNRLEKRR